MVFGWKEMKEMDGGEGGGIRPRRGKERRELCARLKVRDERLRSPIYRVF